MPQSKIPSASNWPSGYQPVWLDAAWRELGQHEVAGGAGNARIMALFRDAGHSGIKDDDVAWCAAYVGAVLARTGFTPSGSLRARSYLRWGEELIETRLGAIAIFSRGSDPGAGHVAFVVGETSQELIVLGGNQSNGVTVTALPRSRLLGLRWPTAAGIQASHHRTPQMRDTFAAALAHVVEMEGGFGDDLFDPGGPTNMGLTLADLSRFRGLAMTAENRDEFVEELRRIDRAEVDAMYRTLYWLPARCDALPAPIALFHFDTAVNMGVGTAARMLQTALGVTVDGEIGRETVAAAAIAGAAEVLDEYARLRRNRYRSLPAFPRFGRGWLARASVRSTRASRPFPPPSATQGPDQMTDNHAASDIATTERKWWGSSMTIWGAVVTGLAAVLPSIGPALGVEIPKEAVTQGAEQIGAIVQAATGLAGTLMTVLGRIRAAQPISRREFTIRV